VHVGIILVNDQLDAQLFFLVRLFQSSACFEQSRAHYQENQLYQYKLWHMSLCVSGRLVCRSGPTCILGGHLHKVTCNKSCIDTIDSPDNEHEVARNMQRIEINIYIKKELYVKLVIYQNTNIRTRGGKDASF
jgi:hypothetical protein